MLEAPQARSLDEALLLAQESVALAVAGGVPELRVSELISALPPRLLEPQLWGAAEAYLVSDVRAAVLFHSPRGFEGGALESCHPPLLDAAGAAGAPQPVFAAEAPGASPHPAFTLSLELAGTSPHEVSTPALEMV